MISIKVQLTPSWPSFASHPEPPSFASSSPSRFLSLGAHTSRGSAVSRRERIQISSGAIFSSPSAIPFKTCFRRVRHYYRPVTEFNAVRIASTPFFPLHLCMPSQYWFKCVFKFSAEERDFLRLSRSCFAAFEILMWKWKEVSSSFLICITRRDAYCAIDES